MFISRMNYFIIFMHLIAVEGVLNARTTAGELIYKLNNSEQITEQTFYWPESASEKSIVEIQDNKKAPVSGTGNYLSLNNVRKQTIYTKTSIKKEKPDNSKKNIYSKNKFIKYKIKSGDTLYSLSRKYGVSVKSLCKINNIARASKIKRNMIITIPLCKSNLSRNKVNDHNSQNPVTKTKIYKKKIVGKSAVKNFKWPVDNVKVVKRDGMDGIKNLGINILCQSGARVKSSAPGVVKKIGYMRGYGNYIVIKHESGFFSIYSKLESVYVSEGDRIVAQFAIGKLDKLKHELHFQINKNGKVKDPLKFLPARS